MIISDPKSILLPNGLQVVFVPHKESSSITIHVRGKAGSNYEYPNEISVAHLAEHLIIRKSQNLINDTGGRVVTLTSRDDVLFMVKVLKKDVEKGFKFLSDNLIDIKLNDENLEITKEIVRNEIKRSTEIPERFIAQLPYKSLYPTSRLSGLNTGELENLENITIDKIGTFVDRCYCAKRFILVVCGNLKKDRVFKLAEKYFANMKGGALAEKLTHKMNQKFLVHSINKPICTQAHIRIDFYGYTLSEHKRYASEHLTKIIDGYLKTTFRSRLGYAYSVGCSSFSTGSYGLTAIYIAVKEDNAFDTFCEIKLMLKNLEKLIKIKNLRLVKNQILSNIAFEVEKTSPRADFYSQMWLHTNSKITLKNEIKNFEKVKRGDAIKVANDLLHQKPKITVLSQNLNEEEVKKWWHESLRFHPLRK